MNDEDRILCETPTPGKQGTRIDRWKYEAVRAAILRALTGGEQGVPFKELPTLVEMGLTEKDLAGLGSLVWYTTTVKLHLETIGEIERVPGARPQRIRHANPEEKP